MTDKRSPLETMDDSDVESALEELDRVTGVARPKKRHASPPPTVSLPPDPVPKPPKPPVIRVHRDPEPAPARSMFPASMRTWNPASVISVIVGACTAITGAVTGISATFNSGMTKDQAQSIRTDIAAIRKDTSELREYLAHANEVDRKRWEIIEATICKLNGGPFARKVRCDAVIDWDVPPLGANGPWKAQLEYPDLPKPPVLKN